METEKSYTFKPEKRQFIAKYWAEFFWFGVALLLSGSNIPLLKAVAMGAALLFLLVLAYALWLFKTVRWEVNEQNIVFIRGIFNRETDYIEMYRVVDYKEEQNLLQQFFNIKTLVIYSGDQSHTELEIYGLAEDCRIIEFIRENVEKQKQKKKIYEITNR